MPKQYFHTECIVECKRIRQSTILDNIFLLAIHQQYGNLSTLDIETVR